MTETLSLPAKFNGRVRLFPLPDLVMFPHALQPLHIFEPRYVDLMQAALAEDRLIAMSLLRPGWQTQYEKRPPIHPMVCLVRIVSHARLEDGRYNVLVQGVRRATIIREESVPTAFRQADVAVLEDLYPAKGAIRRTQLRAQLMDCFRNLAPATSPAEAPFDTEQTQALSLGALTDIVSYSLTLELDEKLKLLAEWNVDRRAGILLQRLREIVDGIRSATDSFPPKFSEN